MTTKGGSLAEHLDLRNMPLATTPGGRAFVLKALHPSDHEIKTTRVPGGNTLSVAVCSDQVQTINIVNANANVEINVIPNPVVPATMTVDDGGSTTNYAVLNAAFGGSLVHDPKADDIKSVVAKWSESVERYRITSQSVTVELIAPSLSDQGTITAAQYHVPPRTANPSKELVQSINVMNITPDVYLYEKPVLNTQLILGTQAYTSRAREGVYMPLKLTTFKWKDANDPFIPYSTNREMGYAIQSNFQVSEASGWPFLWTNATATASSDLAAIPKCCGSNFGFINFRGMAANIAIRIRVRQVIEVACRPSSMYAPLVEVALPPDEMALRMYHEISAKMADGYPASYNDLGKLKNIIMGLGKKLAPYVDPALSLLSGIPGPVGAIASGVKTVLPVAKTVVSAFKKKPLK